MAQIAIRLNTLTEVKEFNAAAAQIPGDVDLRSGHYCVDAKSIMGIFSLNLSRGLTEESATMTDDELRKHLAAYLAE